MMVSRHTGHSRARFIHVGIPELSHVFSSILPIALGICTINLLDGRLLKHTYKLKLRVQAFFKERLIFLNIFFVKSIKSYYIIL